MYVQSPNLGTTGLLPDQPKSVLPVGAWANGRNMRFNDGYIERIPEPEQIIATDQAGKWLQLYEDNDGPRIAYASDGKLYRLNLTGDAWEDVTNPSIGTYGAGVWQSFQLGTSVVFNNGIDPPQILYSGTVAFRTLPNWGELTSGQKTVTCASLRAFGSYMVAMDVTIDGVRSQNAVWTSDPVLIDNVSMDSEMPSWDYEDPATTSALNYIGVEYGAIVDGLELNNNFMVYTRNSAHVLQLIGGQFTFGNRKALPYGIASLGAVAAYLNQHFCIGPATIYTHDGSTVLPVADARVENDFYRRLNDFALIRCTENQETKEIHTLFTSVSGREYLIFNYKDNNFSFGNATVSGDSVVCMAYDLRPSSDVETYETITTTYATETRTYAQMGKDGEERAMFWLTANNLHEAEKLTVSDAQKQYFVERGGIDFSELNPALTTNQSKSLHELIPHIEGAAPTQFTLTAAQTLRETAFKTQVLAYDPVSDYKIDTRITGRWLGMRIDLTDSGDWRLSTMDFDIEATDDR